MADCSSTKKDQNHWTPKGKLEMTLFVGIISGAITMVYFTMFLPYQTFLSFELVCQTTNSHQLDQHFKMIDASSRYKLFDAARYLLQLSPEHLYYSARASRARMPSRTWEAYYESLAVQATQDFFQMNLKSNYTPQDKTHQYIVVKLLVATVEDIDNLPYTNIKTLGDVIRSLRVIKSMQYGLPRVEDLFWTHPLNNITDILVPLNLIVQPQRQVYPMPKKLLLQSQFYTSIAS